jgi:hypothetical protein
LLTQGSVLGDGLLPHAVQVVVRATTSIICLRMAVKTFRPHFTADIVENEVDPRFGIAVKVPRINWVFHAFYGHTALSPPLAERPVSPCLCESNRASNLTHHRGPNLSPCHANVLAVSASGLWPRGPRSEKHFEPWFQRDPSSASVCFDERVLWLSPSTLHCLCHHARALSFSISQAIGSTNF